MPSSSLRILIVRLSAIGDVIHGLPVLNALRRHCPHAHLSWVVEGRAGDLLKGHAALDRLIVAPRGWLKHPRQIWRLRRQLRECRPDIAVDLQGLARSAIAAWLSGAPVRIGFAGRDGRELSGCFNNTLVEPAAVHVIDRNLELLQPLHIEPQEIGFDLPESREAAEKAERFLLEEKVRDFAVINPGAGWPSKRWEMDRYAQVAAHLGRKHRLPSIVVWAGEAERAWAKAIVSQSDGHARTAPATTLRELAELVRRASLFIGSDTGPLHIAAAVGTPCVALFGPVAAERNGPYGYGHIALQKKLVTGSSRKRRTAGNQAMRAISVEDVNAACDQILTRSERKSA